MHAVADGRLFVWTNRATVPVGCNLAAYSFARTWLGARPTRSSKHPSARPRGNEGLGPSGRSGGPSRRCRHLRSPPPKNPASPLRLSPPRHGQRRRLPPRASAPFLPPQRLTRKLPCAHAIFLTFGHHSSRASTISLLHAAPTPSVRWLPARSSAGALPCSGAAALPQIPTRTVNWRWLKTCSRRRHGSRRGSPSSA